MSSATPCEFLRGKVYFVSGEGKIIKAIAFLNYGIEHAIITTEKLWRNNFQGPLQRTTHFYCLLTLETSEMCLAWFGSPHVICLMS